MRIYNNLKYNLHNTYYLLINEFNFIIIFHSIEFKELNLFLTDFVYNSFTGNDLSSFLYKIQLFEYYVIFILPITLT